MERIAVIGCGGAGKTTLSRRIGAALGIPVTHVDGEYWHEVEGRRVESTPERWRERHRELIARERWVLDGMKLGVLPERLAAADAVVFLDLPTAACLWGIACRRLRFRGRSHPELGIYDRISWEFVTWILGFRRRQRPRILALLCDYDGELIVVRRRREAEPVPARLAAGSGPRCAPSGRLARPTLAG